MLRQKTMGGVWQRRFVLLILGVMLAIVFILFRPWNIANLSSHPRAVQSYAEAVQRIETLQAQQTARADAF